MKFETKLMLAWTGFAMGLAAAFLAGAALMHDDQPLPLVLFAMTGPFAAGMNLQRILELAASRKQD